MNALTVVFAALCIFAIGYRFYGLFIANKVLNLNDARVTPAVKYSDGHDYVDTNKYVLFGHHFAAIAAAGPLLGPVLAAQFGYMPGLLWILIGCVLAGGVHDMVVLFASVRHRGQSLAYIASQEIDKTTGSVAAWAVLAILLLTLAGLSIAVVNAMHNSLWSTYTVAATIPIAIIMGLYLQIWRKGDVLGATLLGVVLLFLCILSGPWVASHPEYFGFLDIDRKTMSVLIPIFGGLTKRTSVNRARNNWRIAELQRDATLRTLQSEVAQAYQQMLGAGKEFVQASKKAEAARLAYEAVAGKYERGMVSALDLQTASDKLLQARAERIRTRLQYIIKTRLVEYYNGEPLIR